MSFYVRPTVNMKTNQYFSNSNNKILNNEVIERAGGIGKHLLSYIEQNKLNWDLCFFFNL